MSNDYLSYLDFRRAATRNISICEILLKKYESENQITQRHILYKIYYLSGYVIEFLYKFSLFHHLCLEGHENVYEYGDEVFQKKWKVHNFTKLNMLCEEKGLRFSADIPYFGNYTLNANSKKLFDMWDVQIRYSLNLNLSKKKINLNYNDLNEFMETVKEINKKITTIYS